MNAGAKGLKDYMKPDLGENRYPSVLTDRRQGGLGTKGTGLSGGTASKQKRSGGVKAKRKSESLGNLRNLEMEGAGLIASNMVDWEVLKVGIYQSGRQIFSPQQPDFQETEMPIY